MREEDAESFALEVATSRRWMAGGSGHLEVVACHARSGVRRRVYPERGAACLALSASCVIFLCNKWVFDLLEIDCRRERTGGVVS